MHLPAVHRSQQIRAKPWIWVGFPCCSADTLFLDFLVCQSSYSFFPWATIRCDWLGASQSHICVSRCPFFAMGLCLNRRGEAPASTHSIPWYNTDYSGAYFHERNWAGLSILPTTQGLQRAIVFLCSKGWVAGDPTRAAWIAMEYRKWRGSQSESGQGRSEAASALPL